MGIKNLHTVQKQVIDITLPDANAALDWEANKRQGFTTMINSQLEKCFDEFDKSGTHFIIEKLNIDLGVFNMHSMQTELPERLYIELQKKLEHHLNVSINTNMAFDDKAANNSKGNILYNEQQGRLQALFFFLNNGYLPWWGTALANWDKDWLQKLEANEINNLKSFLIDNDNRSIYRLINQFSDDFIENVLSRMNLSIDTDKAWSWLEKALINLQKQKASSSEINLALRRKSLIVPAVRSKYWFAWIEHAIGKGDAPALYDLFDNDSYNLIIRFLVNPKESSKDLNAALSEIPKLWKEELNAFKQQLNRKDSSLKKQTKPAENNKEDQTEFQSKHKKNISGNLSSENIINAQNKPTDTTSEVEDKASSDDSTINKAEIEETEALFVSDAGLILLHPFLPQLFTSCGWIDKNNFLNDYTQTMAVYALHYLATGKTEAPEHELALHKFLAGISWETPLEPVELLSDEEKAACDELLIEVLKHWKPLRNTSPDGLREGFLQRNGKLEHVYSGWHLIIEQKTLDVLLGHLPWGTSLIKLQWMPEMLTVTWQ